MTFKNCCRRMLALTGAVVMIGSSFVLTTAYANNTQKYMPETLLTRINIKFTLTDADIALAIAENGLEAKVQKALEDFVTSEQTYTTSHLDKRFEKLSADQLYVGKSFRIVKDEWTFIKDESTMSYPIYKDSSVYGLLNIQKDTSGKLNLSTTYCTDALSMALKLSGSVVMVNAQTGEDLQGLLAVCPKGYIYELSKTFEESKDDVYYRMNLSEMPSFILSESHLSPGIPTKASRSYSAPLDIVEAQSISNGLYRIKNLYSGLYLTYNKADKGFVQKGIADSDSDNQIFKVSANLHTGRNFPPFNYEISLTAAWDGNPFPENFHSYLGLPKDTYVENGTRLIASGDWQSSMDFVFIPAGESSYRILSNKVTFLKNASALEVAGASKSSGAPVQLWEYRDASNQKWVLEKISAL